MADRSGFQPYPEATGFSRWGIHSKWSQKTRTIPQNAAFC